jgi:RND family efflux transporter MFP subunit
VFVALFVGAGGGVAWLITASRSMSIPLVAAEPAPRRSDGSSQTPVAPVRVGTIKPTKGGLERTTTQPGTVIAFESAELFAKVSGYLKSQTVDIGDHVRQGQILAEIDAPELLKAVEQASAALGQAKAQVVQANARVLTSEADRDAAVAAVKQAEAEIERAAAARAFREKQYERIKKLFELKSIDERLVDEKLDEMESARAAERLAHAGVANATALATAATARIAQAKADADEARSKVEVAQAAMEKSEVFVDYLRIVSPYDGVITHRNFFRGDFIRSADQDARTALLTVDRTDLMRVVVQVPDRDVPLTNAGDTATVDIDALPGTRFTAKVSRVAEAEDSQTRTMRTEIDLPNNEKLLRQGMYGRVTIHLGTLPGAMRIPSSALVGDVVDGTSRVYTVRDGIAHLTPVRVGRDDGLQIEILGGLTAEDEVVRQPNSALVDGARVTAERVPSNKADARTPAAR